MTDLKVDIEIITIETVLKETIRDVMVNQVDIIETIALEDIIGDLMIIETIEVVLKIITQAVEEIIMPSNQDVLCRTNVLDHKNKPNRY
jgi:hypothetical protein